MLRTIQFLAQSQTQSSSGGGIIGACFGVVWLAVVVLIIAGFWKVFVKAGQPGWASIIPIYNVYVLLQIIHKPVWWLVLFFIPFVNLVITIIVALEVAKVFGKSAAYGVGLAILPFVFYPLLGFGDARYVG